MRRIVLADRYYIDAVILEEKEIWVHNTLIMLGMSQEELIDCDPNELVKYEIEVWDHLGNGDVEILQNNVLVGKWYTPTLIAKYDDTNKIYYEIHLDYNSIADNEIYSSGDVDG